MRCRWTLMVVAALFAMTFVAGTAFAGGGPLPQPQVITPAPQAELPAPQSLPAPQGLGVGYAVPTETCAPAGCCLPKFHMPKICLPKIECPKICMPKICMPKFHCPTVELKPCTIWVPHLVHKPVCAPAPCETMMAPAVPFLPSAQGPSAQAPTPQVVPFPQAQSGF